MNLNGIKIFFRNVRKQKVMTLMSIFGLSLGMAIAILVGLWSVQEFNYDNFHRHGDRIYRVLYNDNREGHEYKNYTGFGPMGETGKEQIPEVEAMCRIVNVEDTELSNEKIRVNQRYYEQFRIIMTDENFFNFFTFRLKEGQENNVLYSMDGMVIDQSTAALLFPGENAVGKVVSYA
ncbi:MAG: ABC transporter permease, partial [Odoribacter splanchnicus]|nr:ABC transporter permease [Odoribacter splanchnicus]